MRYTIVVTVVGLVATALAAPQGRSDGNPFGGNPFGGNPLGGNPLGGNPLGSADACYCCPGAFSNPASGECAALNSQTDTGVYCADYEIVMCCSADGGTCESIPINTGSIPGTAGNVGALNVPVIGGVVKAVDTLLNGA